MYVFKNPQRGDGFSIWPIDYMVYFLGQLSIFAALLLRPKGEGAKLTSLLRVLRGCLGLIISGCFLYFCEAVQMKLGRLVRKWTIVLTVSQFHFMFYCSRAVPDVLTLGLVMVAMTTWLNQDHWMCTLSSYAAILIFRCEAVLLLLPITLGELYARRLSVKSFIRFSMWAAVMLLAVSIPVDSYFWRRWVWPNGVMMWSGISQTSQWRTAPYLWYIYSAIPRALGFSTIFVPIGIFMAPKLKTIIIPTVLFIIMFSFWPYKELHFIIYILPALNVSAAVALSIFFHRMLRYTSWSMLLVGIISVSHVLGNLVWTGSLIYIHRHNYPGGVAMQTLHELETKSTSYVNVHIDAVAAETGITRFTQLHNGWSYNITEDFGPAAHNATHMIIGVSSNEKEASRYLKTYDLLASVNGFHQVKIIKSLFPLEFELTEKTCILRKKMK